MDSSGKEYLMSKSLSRRMALAGLVVGTSLLTGTAARAQKAKSKGRKYPRLEKAIDDLRDARQYLLETPHKFGGHKKKAIDSLDAAIAQLGLAIESED